MKKHQNVLFLIGLLLLMACKKDKSGNDGYDIILIIGQSNTHKGNGLDYTIDTPQKGIYQLKRLNENYYGIVEATEPLDHPTKSENTIGFGLTFTKLYKEMNGNDRDVLIIPSGYGGSGFVNNRWNKGDDLYESAALKVNYVMASNPKSEVKVILWHQGEADTHNPNYQQNLDEFIMNFRTEIKHIHAPFILGGMVPYWIETHEDHVITEAIIKSTPNRIANTEYADTNHPFTIYKEDNEDNIIHFDAIGQRELGTRYFDAYLRMRD